MNEQTEKVTQVRFDMYCGRKKQSQCESGSHTHRKKIMSKAVNKKLLNLNDINLNNEQTEVLEKLVHWWNYETKYKQTFEISGYAGTGKTTLIRYLIQQIGLDHSEVQFVAYVGKATLVMQLNGLNACTIHKAITYVEKKRVTDDKGLVEIDGVAQYKISSHKKEEIDSRIKLFVVDEGSMVPEKLAKWLLSYEVPIIVLGDLNQLPPVNGSSYFLRKPDAILTQIMRQSVDSPIPYIAKAASMGQNIFRVSQNINNQVIIKPASKLTKEEIRNADIVL